MLTPDQQEAFNNIIACINDAVFDNPYCTRTVSLSGGAGVGKTFLTARIIENIQGKYSIKVTCTTHKALKVVRDMLKLPDSIKSSTIHSHLALKMKTNFLTGNQELIQDTKRNIERVDVLFCDESSMVSDELYNHVQNAIERRLVKIVVFIGDSKQLLPIDGNQNPVYSGKFQYELTEIVRQAADNKIIQLSTILRKCIENQKFLSNAQLKECLNRYIGEDIIHCPTYNEFLGKYFEDIEIPENERKSKFICTFTNSASEVYNKICRAKIKGEDIPSLIVGDEVVFHEMHLIHDDVIHVNNEIVKIRQLELLPHHEVPDVEYWSCTDMEGRHFNVLEHSSKTTWDKYLQTIANCAKLTSDRAQKSELWRQFYETKETMSTVSFTFAGTTHRCQGSSYDEIYVDFDEILSYRRYDNDDLIFRLLYVGVTRASKTAIIKMK